jgi:hypothetical protein
MLLLFDQVTPLPLRNYLTDHTVVSAYEKGWHQYENGKLLRAAESEGFDALITTDQNLRHQQDLSGRKISVVVLLTTNWLRIERSVSLVQDAIANIDKHLYQEVSFPTHKKTLP